MTKMFFALGLLVSVASVPAFASSEAYQDGPSRPIVSRTVVRDVGSASYQAFDGVLATPTPAARLIVPNSQASGVQSIDDFPEANFAPFGTVPAAR